MNHPIRWIVVALLLLGPAPAPITALPRCHAAEPEGEAFFFTPGGFNEEGKPLTASGPGTAELRVTVRDESTGKPTPCRIAIVGPDGNYYQPAPDHLTKYAITGVWPKEGAWGNRPEKAPWRYLGRYFYSTGESVVRVPPGKVRIEVGKGFEFAPATAAVTAVADKPIETAVTIRRTLPVEKESAYYSGDMHLHFSRETDADDQTIFDLLDAEDIWYGTTLAYNEPAGPYAGFMEKMAAPQFRKLGPASFAQRGQRQIVSGQEYRTGFFGHLNLYQRDRLVFEGQSFHADDGPVYGEVGAATQELGGYAFYAHGGYAQEIYADAALGTVNGVELLQFGIYRGIGLDDWYHMLNAGYRFPIIGASDFPACRFLADCRTYVWCEKPGKAPQPAPPIADWLKGAALGQSFVSTGPILELEVDGHRPGETIDLGNNPRRLTIKVRARCAVAKILFVDWIINGKTVRHVDVPADRQSNFTGELVVEANSPCWIAARAWSTTPGGQPDAESHTNPVYVYAGGRAPFVKASLDAWVEKIDGQIEVHTKRNFAQKAKALAYFQKARDLLLAIRERGGLKVGENPARLAAELTLAEKSAGRDLTLEGGRPDLTEDELREFLKPVPPRPPAEALRTFEVAPGFEVQLVAAEPLVVDPVAAAFDADGNLYVCQLRDYPFKPADGAEPIGDVRLLRDTDGDGTFDESHVFADKLLWAAGVVPWKGGVFVAAPPDIWYLKDTDGDFRADVRRKVFTGFGTENQQAMLNNLQFGLDHRIYGATAGNGGLIRPAGDEQAPVVSVNGRDFRFDPVTEKFEPVTGTIQFGNAFDDTGNRFVCSESQPLLHIVLPDHYIARNPYLATPHPIQNLAPGPVPIFRTSPVERWRHIRSSRRIAKNERAAMSAGASHHVVDAAAGVTVYRGGAYPPEFYGNVFVGDGQNNLVHRRRLVPEGVTFRSERVEERSEFLRSSDIWFRPVNFVNAPDGTLYCLDLSREVLESIHIPLDVVKHLDLASGRNYGRIYRIAPAGFKPPRPPRLSRAETSTLVAALDSPHGWWRDTAHRLLYERQDSAAVEPLRRLLGKSARPASRIACLWSLEGLTRLDDATLLTALADGDAGVRETAVRLAEPRLDASDRVRDAVSRLVDDPAPRVRFQVAFSLGQSKHPGIVAALARLARRDGGDVWMRTAILSSALPHAEPLLAMLVSDGAASAAQGEAPFHITEAGRTVLAALAHLVGARHNSAEVERVVGLLADQKRVAPPLAESLFSEVVRGLSRSAGQIPEFPTQTPAGSWIAARVASALSAARDPQADEARRRAAIELLGSAPHSEITELLLSLTGTNEADAIRITAIRALTERRDPGIAPALIVQMSAFTPDVRRAALDLLLAGDERTLALLEAAAQGEVSLADLEPARREFLAKHRHEGIRKLAGQLFAGQANRERRTVVDEYQAALALAGDPRDGLAVFEKNCAACHQLAGRGHAIGPNLASSSVRDPRALLSHILDPNQYVLPNYVQYVVSDRRGRTYTGLLASQTATSVTLKKDQGETATILRGEIDEMVSTGKSLMPEGVERSITPQDMAHLIAFLMDAAATAPPGNENAERDFGTLPGLVEPPSGKSGK